MTNEHTSTDDTSTDDTVSEAEIAESRQQLQFDFDMYDSSEKLQAFEDLVKKVVELLQHDNLDASESEHTGQSLSGSLPPPSAQGSSLDKTDVLMRPCEISDIDVCGEKKDIDGDVKSVKVQEGR